MASRGIYNSLLQRKQNNIRSLAVLIDPDKCALERLPHFVVQAQQAGADYFFVGSSLLVQNTFSECLVAIRKYAHVPVVIFPGSCYQVSPLADAILLLSLISGRNAEFLIGQQVAAATALKKSNLEIISTGYVLIDGGRLTSVHYISQTLPVPADKPDIAVATALAGEMLGLKTIYLEAGSGAAKSVSPAMISAVRENISIPLLTGGGIRDAEKAFAIARAGADVVVIGNSFEQDPSLLFEMACAVHEAGHSSQTQIHSP
ncbi:MAG: geranylgeranylglyceryl phosphate synthase [Chitinophagales bacterium]|nr:MAG: geranylgeranylglyceryl phosphate synthase [Chitinophagales bacterium]